MTTNLLSVYGFENKGPYHDSPVILQTKSVSLEIKHDLQTDEQMICTMKYIVM